MVHITITLDVTKAAAKQCSICAII